MLPKRWFRIAAVGGAIALLAAGAAYLISQPTVIRGGAAPLSWAECQPEQIQVMVLGTFHFAQVPDLLDVLEPERQDELAGILDGLEEFDPDRIAVERAHTRAAELDSAYNAYLGLHEESLGSRNEIQQIGFRLARRLGHDRVYAVDVPMNLWHDSIAIFDERWPDARDELRGRWEVTYEGSDPRAMAELSLSEILTDLNTDLPPGNAEMYRRFLPLVKDEVYAGALKLRPWYDRNLRIVQNLFRALEPEDERLLLVIGSGHLRVLKQMLELTPQLCPVDAVPYLSPAESEGSAE